MPQKYKLIKLYPNSPELGEILDFTNNDIVTDRYQRSWAIEDCSEYPEFWEKVTVQYALILKENPKWDLYDIIKHPSGFVQDFYFDIDVIAESYIKLFSSYKEAELYRNTILKPKFKVGDIVVMEASELKEPFFDVFKIEEVNNNTVSYIDREKYTYRIDENLRLATSEEILEYYREQGYVKGMRFREKCNLSQHIIDGLQYNLLSGNLCVNSNSTLFTLSECELVPKQEWFKLGDIVNWKGVGTTGKVIELRQSELIVDNPRGQDIPYEDVELASEANIIRYYEQQGWVKAAKFKVDHSDVKGRRTIKNIGFETISGRDYVVVRPTEIVDKDDWFNIKFCELIKEPVYPKSWNDLPALNISYKVKNNYVGARLYVKEKEAYVTEKQADSALAFAQLTQLHAEIIKIYNEANNCDWKPNWKGGVKEIIIRKDDRLVIDYCMFEWYPLVFPKNSGLAEFSLLHHKDLWSQYYELC